MAFRRSTSFMRFTTEQNTRPTTVNTTTQPYHFLVVPCLAWLTVPTSEGSHPLMLRDFVVSPKVGFSQKPLTRWFVRLLVALSGHRTRCILLVLVRRTIMSVVTRSGSPRTKSVLLASGSRREMTRSRYSCFACWCQRSQSSAQVRSVVFGHSRSSILHPYVVCLLKISSCRLWCPRVGRSEPTEIRNSLPRIIPKRACLEDIKRLMRGAVYRRGLTSLKNWREVS